MKLFVINHYSLIFCSLILGMSVKAANYGNPYRAKAMLLRNKGYELRYDLKYFSQSARYNKDGEKIEDTEETSFTLIDNDLSLAYGIGNSIELRGSGRFRNVAGSKTVGNESFSPKKSGVESLMGEFLYAFPSKDQWRYGASVFYRQTLYSHNKALASSYANDTLELGDDGSEYGGGIFFSKGNTGWIFDGELQFVSPANDLAREVRYQLGLNYKGNNWALLSGVEGVKSVGDDQYSDDVNNKPVSASVNYTSLFDSINRSYMKPYLGINYAFKSFMIGGKVTTTVSPISTDAGNEIFISFTTQNVGETEEKVKIERFKEYSIDGSVLKVSGRGNFVKIDQGLQSDVEKGKKFDIYQTDYFGGNELVAEGVVYEVGSDWSIIKLTKKYKNIEIRPGFSARGD